MASARTLAARSRRASGLPPLWFVTDPERTPDPARIAAALPRGAGVIFRAFGRPDALQVGARLAAICRARGLVLLVGADARLAHRLQADGVHLPERALHLARRLKARGLIVTGAAHGASALRRAAAMGCDAALLSPVFTSRSPSAAKPIGPTRFAALVRGARLPVYGLGGINGRTARRLSASGAAGLAAVDGVDEGGSGAQ